jgi:peptidoglycan/xylan/chitin deacetylase (PgdA/CDA1 family)
MRIASFSFHEVCDDPAESGWQRAAALPYKHPFRKYCEHLDAIGAGPVAPGLLEGYGRAPRLATISFDDGGVSNVGAAEELVRRGWRGYFFVVSGLVGKKGFMDEAQIRYLRSCGHVIGSHSATHPDIFRSLKPAQMLEEWRVSCDRLADLLGEPVDTAAIPGGDGSRLVYEKAAEAGLKTLFTSEPRLEPENVGGMRVLGRFCLKRDTPNAKARELANFEGWQRENAIRKAKVGARILLFPAYKAWVYWKTRPFAAAR